MEPEKEPEKASPSPLQMSMQDLLTQLDEYQPTIPDAVALSYMTCAGLETTDPKVVRLLSLAAQKFIADISNEALQHCKMKGTAQTAKKNPKDKKYALTLEDLLQALAEYGIQVKKPLYYN